MTEQERAEALKSAVRNLRWDWKTKEADAIEQLIVENERLREERDSFQRVGIVEMEKNQILVKQLKIAVETLNVINLYQPFGVAGEALGKISELK